MWLGEFSKKRKKERNKETKKERVCVCVRVSGTGISKKKLRPAGVELYQRRVFRRPQRQQKGHDQGRSPILVKGSTKHKLKQLAVYWPHILLHTYTWMHSCTYVYIYTHANNYSFQLKVNEKITAFSLPNTYIQIHLIYFPSFKKGLPSCIFASPFNHQKTRYEPFSPANRPNLEGNRGLGLLQLRFFHATRLEPRFRRGSSQASRWSFCVSFFSGIPQLTKTKGPVPDGQYT